MIHVDRKPGVRLITDPPTAEESAYHHALAALRRLKEHHPETYERLKKEIGE